MIDVFVSRPTWVAAEFEVGLRMFMTRLADLEMRPRTLGSTDYGTKAPLDDVIRILKECRGAVILGYPQIVVTEGTLKGNAVSGPFLLATEWNHMETGLAYAEGLPLLVIHHVGVSRGVFDEVLGFRPTAKTVRSPVYHEIDVNRTALWMVRGVGRRIGDPQPLEDHYRERAECRIEELNEFYVRLLNIGSGQLYTVPLGDVTISRDEKAQRPLIEVRRKNL